MWMCTGAIGGNSRSIQSRMNACEYSSYIHIYIHPSIHPLSSIQHCVFCTTFVLGHSHNNSFQSQARTFRCVCVCLYLYVNPCWYCLYIHSVFFVCVYFMCFHHDFHASIRAFTVHFLSLFFIMNCSPTYLRTSPSHTSQWSLIIGAYLSTTKVVIISIIILVALVVAAFFFCLLASCGRWWILLNLSPSLALFERVFALQCWRHTQMHSLNYTHTMAAIKEWTIDPTSYSFNHSKHFSFFHSSWCFIVSFIH